VANVTPSAQVSTYYAAAALYISRPLEPKSSCDLDADLSGSRLVFRRPVKMIRAIFQGIRVKEKMVRKVLMQTRKIVTFQIHDKIDVKLFK
jgi:hypothetical protein